MKITIGDFLFFFLLVCEKLKKKLSLKKVGRKSGNRLYEKVMMLHFIQTEESSVPGKQQ